MKKNYVFISIGLKQFSSGGLAFGRSQKLKRYEQFCYRQLLVTISPAYCQAQNGIPAKMQYEDFERQLRALEREYSRLYKEERNLGWVELEEPIIRGWKRYFVVRNDIVRSGSKVFFEDLLKKINTVQYCHRKDFKKKKRKGGKKLYFPINQYLLKPGKPYVQKFKFTEKQLSYFEERPISKQGQLTGETEYVIKQPWRFVLRIRPNIITHIRAKDAEIERRMHEISNYLDRNSLNGKLDHLLRGYHHYRWRNYSERVHVGDENPLKNKSLSQILDWCRQEND